MNLFEAVPIFVAMQNRIGHDPRPHHHRPPRHFPGHPLDQLTGRPIDLDIRRQVCHCLSPHPNPTLPTPHTAATTTTAARKNHPQWTRYQHHLIAILERMSVPAQKPYVLIIHIHVDEPPQPPVLILHVLRQRRKLRIELHQQPRQVLRLRHKRLLPIRMPRQRRWATRSSRSQRTPQPTQALPRAARPPHPAREDTHRTPPASASPHVP